LINKIVLDASALLAVLNREPGTDRLISELLSTATSSTVNLAKVQGKLVSLGLVGGRACLALGIALRAPVYTADRSWKKLKFGRSDPCNPLATLPY
jgi:ribonuclease VapC